MFDAQYSFLFRQCQVRLLSLVLLLLITSPHQSKSDNFADTFAINIPQFTEPISTSIYNGWESHYFSEGRDVLGGDSLIISHVQASWKFLRNEIWYATSPNQSYDELQYMFVINQTFNNYAVYVGYRHLQFPSDNLNDDEVYAGLSVSDLPVELQAAVDAYYSFVADGFFVEISVLKNFILTEALSFSGTGTFGINQGYISDGHNGANHFALTLQSTYQLSDTISIIARLAQSWTIDRDPDLAGDAQLIDFLNGGISVRWFF